MTLASGLDDSALMVYNNNRANRDSFLGCLAMFAGARNLLLELPHMIIFGVWHSKWGGWFSLNVGIAAVTISMMCSCVRLMLFLAEYDADTTFIDKLYEFDMNCLDDTPPRGDGTPDGQAAQRTVHTGNRTAPSQVGSEPPAGTVAAPIVPSMPSNGTGLPNAPKTSAPGSGGSLYPPPGGSSRPPNQVYIG